MSDRTLMYRLLQENNIQAGIDLFDMVVDEYAKEVDRLNSDLEKVESKNKQLREALESLRETEHYECEDCFYSCPKTGACFKDVPDYAECTCGMDRRNAIIDKALKGGE